MALTEADSPLRRFLGGVEARDPDDGSDVPWAMATREGADPDVDVLRNGVGGVPPEAEPLDVLLQASAVAPEVPEQAEAG